MTQTPTRYAAVRATHRPLWHNERYMNKTLLVVTILLGLLAIALGSYLFFQKQDVQVPVIIQEPGDGVQS